MSIPAVYINCRRYPFIDQIMNIDKTYETRSRNTLKRFLGRRVFLIETGKGKNLVRCSAYIDEIVECYTKEAYEQYRPFHAVPVGSDYDWKPGTKKKVLYHLSYIHPLKNPFTPEGTRHGRTWMECDNWEKYVIEEDIF